MGLISEGKGHWHLSAMTRAAPVLTGLGTPGSADIQVKFLYYALVPRLFSELLHGPLLISSLVRTGTELAAGGASESSLLLRKRLISGNSAPRAAPSLTGELQTGQ